MGLWGTLKRVGTAAATGGLSEVPGVKGLLGTAKDAVIAPNSYDANGELAKSEGMATGTYGTAQAGLAGVQVNAPPTANITAQQIAAPDAITAQQIASPGAIIADKVQASGLVQGPEADALRAQELTQAESASRSPSAAAAQMRSAGTQIAGQQLGQAAMARGADRAGARRAAMLGTGQQGLQAASTTAAMSAQEQATKQAAYTNALQGVRTGDVSVAGAGLQAQTANQQAGLQAQQATAGNELTAAQANQSTGLQAQTATGAQRLTAAQANQGANLTGQQATIQNQQNAWTQGQNAQQGWAGVGLQAIGAQNQAQGVAAGYGAKQDETRQKTAGGLVSGVASALSDEFAKTDIGGIGDDGLDSLMSSTHGTTTDADMAREFGQVDTGPNWRDRLSAGLESMGASLQGQPMSQVRPSGYGQDFLKWQMPELGSSGGGSSNGLSGLVSAAKNSGLLSDTSDERAKRDVERMDDDQVADWAEAVPTAVWRYKRGIAGTDGGEDYHAGTLARGLEGTGPLGKLMVHRREDGLKEVEYGPLGLMVGKGALSRANEALDWAKAAYAMASHNGKGLNRG